jgi:hypothetical protein
MNDSHFDAWTRRRFSLTAGGLGAALLGLIAPSDTAARHHHHKKRCIKLSHACTPGGKRKCCGKHICDEVDELGSGTFCCVENNIGRACTRDQDCCTNGACTAEGVCD